MIPQGKIAVLIYPGVELVDMNGQLDVFLQANQSFDNPGYDVSTVVETNAHIRKRKHRFTALHTLPPYHIMP